MTNIILFIHIISGSICLGTGILALLVVKGSRSHLFSGRLFYYAMLGVIATAVYLAIVGASFFLFSIAVFSLFFILSGKRYLKIVKGKEVTPKRQDWLLSILALVAAIFLSLVGMQQILAGDLTAVVSLVFSILGLVFVIQDFRIYRKKWQPPVLRLRMHLSRMIAAYITTITAFLVAGMKMWNLFAWLMPTLIGTFLIFYFIRQLKSKRINLAIVACMIFILPNLTQAQNDDYKRYRFAKSYVGLDFNFTPAFSSGLALGDMDELLSFQQNAFLTPTVNIGATHFWGYADFYVSINTANLKFKTDQFKNSLHYSTFTGFRVYPFPSKENTLRPYAGYKFSPISYEQNDIKDESATITSVRSTLDLGLTYQTENLYLYLAYNYIPNADFSFPLSRSRFEQINIANQFVTFGVNYMFDSTLGVKNCQICHHFDKVFGSSNKRGWYVGVGPSSAFPIQASSYISEYTPFLDQFSMPAVFPELTLGYHLTKNDVLLNLAFRPIRYSRSAYNYEQILSRNSLVLEGLKVVGDYHGFSPFFGLGIGLESLSLREVDQETMITDIRKIKMTPTFAFGWDIRPARKGDMWLLRTNLRYSPFLELEHKGQAISVQQLEFNFIQFIYYPQRAKAYRNYGK